MQQVSLHFINIRNGHPLRSYKAHACSCRMCVRRNPADRDDPTRVTFYDEHAESTFVIHHVHETPQLKDHAYCITPRISFPSYSHPLLIFTATHTHTSTYTTFSTARHHRRQRVLATSNKSFPSQDNRLKHSFVLSTTSESISEHMSYFLHCDHSLTTRRGSLQPSLPICWHKRQLIKSSILSYTPLKFSRLFDHGS